MLVFQSTFDVAGAGPSEEREKDESPWNWGHSYWFKMPEEIELVLTCAFTELGSAWKKKEPKIDDKSNRTKIDATLIFLIIGSSPKRFYLSRLELDLLS